MTWQWTNHAIQQLAERSLSRDEVEETLVHPDGIVPGTGERKIYQKIYGDKLLRVVTEDMRIITVYKTSRITKYMEGQ